MYQSAGNMIFINYFPQTGDLMADLHSKLLMRRRGISGTAQNPSETGSAMDRISSMIPPPTLRIEQSNTDDDWDD